MKRAKANALLIAATLAVVTLLLFVAELWLRGTEKFATYFEKNGLPAPRPEYLAEPWIYAHTGPGWTMRRREYTETIRFNSEGLVGDLPPIQKRSNEFRIVAVGDSFTEGTGDSEGLGYPGRLRRLLAKGTLRRFEVINGGVGGSDPVYEVELLRRRLMKYAPDLVIMALNRTDLGDLERRGGRERFRADGTLRPRTQAVWEPLFDQSHLFRALLLGWLGYNHERHSPAEAEAALAHTFDELVEVGREANQLVRSSGAQFRFLIHSVPGDVDLTDSSSLIEVKERFRSAGIPYLDVGPAFKKLTGAPLDPAYYWPRDGHLTGKGYQVLAQAILEELDRNGLLKPSN